MPRPKASTSSRRRPIAFVALACAITWPTAALGLDPDSGLSPEIADALARFAKFGPTLAALILVGTNGSAALREFLSRLLPRSDEVGWYALALVAPLALWACALAAHFALLGEVPELEPAAVASFAGLLFVHGVAGGGLGEEPGWRGYLLDGLQRRQSAWSAALVVGLLWGLWHAPAFLLPGTGKDPDAVSFVLFTALTCALSIPFTWLFNGARGSLLAVTLLHASFNASENTFEQVVPAMQASARPTFLYGGLVLLVALVLIAATRGRLNRLP